ncbi:MAG: phosphoadenosine phosphosulfate reductase family protein, partial [Chloroflexota bacterium]
MAQVKTWSKEELGQKGDSLENSSPQDVLRWAIKEFSPDISLACSFGMEDVVLVDMVSRIDPKAKIFYLNTDLLFPETYEVRDQLAQKYGLSFVEVRPTLSLQEQAAQYGEALWSRDPNLCCDLRKVKPWRDY